MTIEKNFYMVTPYSVAETEIVTAPPDAENDVYAGGTTYATDDLVWYNGNVWRSLADSNTGNTPVEGAWWTDLGQVDEGASVWDSGTTYALNQYAVKDGKLWRSTVGSNLNSAPTATNENWQDYGATNRLRAFDGFIDGVASQSDGLSYTLTFTEFVSQIGILRATGTDVQVTVTDDTDGLVYDQTFPLQDDSGINDAWDYCFGPFVNIDMVLIEDLPPYGGADITITISGTNVEVGQIVLGSGLVLGAVKTNSSTGIEDYSTKERDGFNRAFVVERPYSDTAVFDLSIPTQSVGFVKRRLAERRAKATLYFMAGGAPYGMAAYGYFQDFDILHSTPVLADCTLEIEGLG